MDLDAPHFTECTVSGLMFFVLRISQLMGGEPLTFKKVENGWRIRVSKPCSIYGQTLTFLLVVFTGMAFTTDLVVDYPTSFLMNTPGDCIAWLLDILIVLSIVAVKAATGINRMKQTINTIRHLENINKELCNIYPSLSLNKRMRWWKPFLVFSLILGWILTVEFVSIVLTVVNFKHKGIKYVTSHFYLGYSISVMTMQLLVMSFGMTAMSMLPTMEMLNNCLKILLQDLRNNRSSHSNLVTIQRKALPHIAYKSINRVIDTMRINLDKNTSSTLHRLALLYCSICDLLRLLNDSYGIFLVLLVLSYQLHVIMTLYHIIVVLYRVRKVGYSTYEQSTWVFYHVCKLVIVVEPCQRAHEQLDETKDLVKQMLSYTNPQDVAIISELKLFYKHLMLNQVSYSPMKLFTLNRVFIISLVGTITTYLVIMVELR